MGGYNAKRGEFVAVRDAQLHMAKFRSAMEIFFARHGYGADLLDRKHLFKVFLKFYEKRLKMFSKGVGTGGGMEKIIARLKKRPKLNYRVFLLFTKNPFE